MIEVAIMPRNSPGTVAGLFAAVVGIEPALRRSRP